MWIVVTFPQVGTPILGHGYDGREVPRWWPTFVWFSIWLGPHFILNTIRLTSSFRRKNQFVSITFSSSDIIWHNLSILYQFSSWISIQLNPFFIDFKSYWKFGEVPPPDVPYYLEVWEPPRPLCSPGIVEINSSRAGIGKIDNTD